MIKSVKNEDTERILSFCENDVSGVRISCQIKAYGLGRDFLSAWYLDENGEITAVICSFYGNLTLLIRNCNYLSDIRMFIDMLGYDSICMSEDDAESLGFTEYISKKAYRFISAQTEYFSENISEEYYRESYRLICENIPGSFKDDRNSYLSFLSDFTFRKRRNLARIKGTFNDNKIVSCALTSAETESAAIISGVACDNKSRSKGLGKKTVLSLVQELGNEGKTVYVIALNETAEGFYEHIGFGFEKKISFIERK